jgi:hypothetical protein
VVMATNTPNGKIASNDNRRISGSPQATFRAPRSGRRRSTLCSPGLRRATISTTAASTLKPADNHSMVGS